MFIPIGLDQTTVRRLPWVSITIIGLNLAVFLVTAAGVHRANEEIQLRQQEAMAFWVRHPYLAPPSAVPQGERERLKLIAEALRSVSGHAPESQEQRAEEQRQLDALVDRLEEAVASNPFMSLGLVPASPKPLAFLTCMFVHAGWLHLLGNMLFFYLSGPFLEDAFGRPLFAGLYLASGIVSSLVHVAAFPTSQAPLVGASGAIAGIMGAFLVRFAWAKIRFFYWLMVWVGTVDLPAWLVLPLWLLEQLFFAGLAGSSGVAYRAHIGGFAFGFGVALVVRWLKVEERFVSPEIERRISVTQHPGLDQGLDLLARGEAAAARSAFEKVLAVEPRNPDALIAVWQAYCQEDKAEAGAPFLARAIDEELRRNEAGLALDHWREMMTGSRKPGPPALRWRLAAAAEPGDRTGAIEVLRNLAADAGAGVLADKAARRLEAMGEPVLPATGTRRVPSAAVPVASFATSMAGVATLPVGAPPVEPIASPPPPPAFWSPNAGGGAPGAPSAGGLEVEECAAEALQADGLLLRGAQGGADLLPFATVEKIAVAGITAAPRPFLVLDLLLPRAPGQPRRVQRLLSTQFDPRRLTAKPNLPPLDAFRHLVRTIATASGAEVWPPTVMVPSERIPTFPSLEAYEREALAPLA